MADDHDPDATPVRPIEADVITIDLDAAAAARRKVNQTPLRFRFAGQLFEAPPEVAAMAVHHLARDNFPVAFELILGTADAKRFLDLNPSIDDVRELVSELGKAWGIVGNSPASGSGSNPNSRR